MKFFLGVDGGQSGTAALIGDETGRIVGAGEAGPCNHAAAGEGRRKLEAAVRGSVAVACAEAGLDPKGVTFEAACFGMSGGPDDKREIVASILHARHLVVTNDAVIALAGATSTGEGIITIAGTGSIAFGRNASQTARAGGWGHIFGDEGGGFDIARQALRACLRMEEGWGPPTRLREMLLEATDSRDANQMLHRFYGDDWHRSRVARLAPLVDRAAQESDAIALQIIHGAAQDLAMFAGAVRTQLWTEGSEIEIAYIGGVFGSGLLLGRFRELVEMTDGVRCIAPRRGPAEGALLEAYRATGQRRLI